MIMKALNLLGSKPFNTAKRLTHMLSFLKIYISTQIYLGSLFITFTSPQQESDHFSESILGCYMQWAVLGFIYRRNFHPIVQQDLCYFNSVVLGCNMKCRQSSVVRGLYRIKYKNNNSLVYKKIKSFRCLNSVR